MKNYIINGRVAREEISSDICDGTLSKEDIKVLVDIPEVRAAFIGSKYAGKCDKHEWSKKYLENLPNVSVAESFNEDYLNYLADVAEYVKASEKKEKPVWFCVAIGVIVVIVIGVVVYFATRS